MKLAELLALVGTDSEADTNAKLTAIRRLLVFDLTAELWFLLYGRYHAYDPGLASHHLLAVACTACCVAGWWERWARPALVAAACVSAAHVWWMFPTTPNHGYLGLLCLTLLAWLSRGDLEDRVLVRQALSWVIVIGLVAAGLQKLHYGFYFQGELFAIGTSTSDEFARFFAWLLPADELARLQSMPTEVGSGPYRIESPAVLTMSHLTYLGEIGLPVLLLFRKTRGVAVVGILVLVAAIEAGARELFFGGMVVGLTLLFAPARGLSLALPICCAVYTYMVAMTLGWLPHVEIH
jgi:hypothetical protein